MKRDMNLVREILLWAESQEHGRLSNPKLEGYSDEEIGYHIFIMNDGGLVEAEDFTSGGDKSPRGELTHLTWKGHEFISVAKDDTIWAKVIKPIATKLSLDLALELLKAEARKQLGL